MRKYLTVLLCITLSLPCFSQFDKSISIRPMVNINVVLQGLGQNDIGGGFGFDAAFFAKHRLQGLIEANFDAFMGDKTELIDLATNKTGKSPTIYSLKLGPQFFITDQIAIAATYGPAWHVFDDFKHTMDYGYKYSLSGFLGKQRRFLTKLFVADIPVEGKDIRYLGVAAGYRF